MINTTINFNESNEKYICIYEITETGPIKLFGNEMLISESFSLIESLCSQQQLLFGECEASQISFEVLPEAPLLEGKTVEVVMYIGVDDTSTDYVTIGKYVIESDKRSADALSRTVIGYDRLKTIINTDIIDFYNSLSFPLTQLEFRNQLMIFLGVAAENVQLIHDGLVIQNTLTASNQEETATNQSLSAKDILNAICELNGVFGHINRKGNFEFVSLPTTTVYPLGDYDNCNYEEFTCNAITGVELIPTGSDIGGSAGTDSNVYKIKDNFLLLGATQEQLDDMASALLDKISDITYTPLTCSVIYGNPCIEVGDKVSLTTIDDRIVSTYVLSRTLNGIQGLSDNISANGAAKYSEVLNSRRKLISDLNGKYNKISTTIDGLSVEVGSIKEVNNVSTWMIDEVPTLENYPFTEFDDVANHVGDLAIGKKGSQIENYTYRFTVEEEEVENEVIGDDGEVEIEYEIVYHYSWQLLYTIPTVESTIASIKASSDNVSIIVGDYLKSEDGQEVIGEQVSSLIVSPETIQFISNNIVLDGNTTITDAFVEKLNVNNLVARNVLVKESDEEDAEILFKASQNEHEVILGSWQVEKETLSSVDGNFSLSMADGGTTLRNEVSNINVQAEEVHMVADNVYSDGNLIVNNNSLIVRNNENAHDAEEVLSVSYKYAERASESTISIKMSSTSVSGGTTTSYYTETQIKQLVGKYVSIYEKGYSNNFGKVLSYVIIKRGELDTSNISQLIRVDVTYAYLSISNKMPISTEGYSFYKPPTSAEMFSVSKDGVLMARGNVTHEFGSLDGEEGTVVKCSANGVATSLYTVGSSKNRGIYDFTTGAWTIVRNNSDGQVYVYDKDKVGRMIGTTAISSGNAHIPSSGAVYNALPTINGATKTGGTIYAPTTAGTKGYMPVSGGSGAPGWKVPVSTTNVTADNITVGKQSYKTGTISITADANYEVVAVGGFQIGNATTSGGGSSKCFFSQLSTTKTTVSYQLNNYHTADAKVKITIYLIRRPITT